MTATRTNLHMLKAMLERNFLLAGLQSLKTLNTFFTLKYNLICPSLFCQLLFDIFGTCFCLACIWKTNNVIRKDMEDNWGELLCEGLDSVFLVIVIAACYCLFGKAFFKLFRRSLTLFTTNWKKRNNRYSKSLTEIHDFLLFGWHMNTDSRFLCSWKVSLIKSDQIMASTIRSACCECIFSRLVMHSKLIFHLINLIKRDVISIKKQ